MQVGCIIQARLESARLPCKILEGIGGWPMLRHVWHRVSRVNIPVIVATPEVDALEITAALPPTAVVQGYAGDPAGVLQRYLLAAKLNGFDTVMRVTGDCPLIDPEECSRVLKVFNSGHYSYVANDWQKLTSVPDGFGCEVFSRNMLIYAEAYAKPGADWEHVTPWIKRQCQAERTGLHLASPLIWPNPPKLSVDTLEDLERVRLIDLHLPEGPLKFSMETTRVVATQWC